MRLEPGMVVCAAPTDADVQVVLVLGPGSCPEHFRGAVLDAGRSSFWRAGQVDDNWLRDYPWTRLA